MADDLTLGAQFNTFHALSEAVSRWEKTNFISLYKRSSRTIEACSKRATKKFFNPHLKYAEINFACIHGGRKLKSSSSGQRPHQSTFLKDCPFMIKVRATPDGKNLCVKEMSPADSHTHETCLQTFQHLPKQRRLSKEQNIQVGEMLQLKANKKLIQQHLQSTTGKTLILKDIHNIASQNHTNHRNNFEELVSEMKKIEGSSVDAFTDDNDTLQAIAFQTEEMRNTFAAYPELLLIDATYKLNNLRMPLYVLMNVDGNGESEVICLWLVATEDRLTISLLMDKFKERNPNWVEIGVIMADKDMTERDVLTEKLPGAEILICLFHALRSFRREITTEKLGISIGERNLSLELLGKMSHAVSEEQYQNLCEDLKRSAPRCVVEYFNRNWHDIREQWVEGLMHEYCNIWKLDINTSKTKVIVFSRGKIRNKPKIMYGDVLLDVVDDYTYLGIVFNYNGSFTETIRMLYVKASNAMFTILKKAKKLHLDIDTQIQLFNTLVVPIMLYGCEVWGNSDIQLLERLQLQFCKIVLGVKKSTPNAMVYGELGVSPLQLIVKRRMISYYSIRLVLVTQINCHVYCIS
ncbi:hypothetical protein SNE40_020840 [Patella caerulea]|uniref:MULE transposase domain-containing protein n=1 Tax=Patella caerulea TaxID=87958 RepID=A0AAN8J514_PATCE